MARARVKVTDLKSGQDSLLLVTKMNLRGILVESAHTLPPGTPVRLSLNLENISEKIDVQGAIHKIAEKPGGGKGMIIRFVDPKPKVLELVSKSLATPSATAGGGESQEGRAITSQEQTSLVDLNTLSRLTLSSVEDSGSSLPSTFDEEAVHAEQPGLSGATRISNLDDIGPLTVRRRRRHTSLYLTLFLFLISTGLGLWLLDRRTPQSDPDVTEVTATPEATPEAAAPAVAASPITEEEEEEALLEEGVLETTVVARKPTRAPTARPKPRRKRVPGIISKISVKDSQAFVKITIQGKGDLAHRKVTRAMSPRRLIVEFPNVKQFSVKSTITVTKNPLFRVQTKKASPGVMVTFDLYPVAFPRYDLRDRPNSVDLYLFRQ